MSVVDEEAREAVACDNAAEEEADAIPAVPSCKSVLKRPPCQAQGGHVCSKGIKYCKRSTTYYLYYFIITLKIYRDR